MVAFISSAEGNCFEEYYLASRNVYLYSYSTTKRLYFGLFTKEGNHLCTAQDSSVFTDNCYTESQNAKVRPCVDITLSNVLLARIWCRYKE